MSTFVLSILGAFLILGCAFPVIDWWWEFFGGTSLHDQIREADSLARTTAEKGK